MMPGNTERYEMMVYSGRAATRNFGRDKSRKTKSSRPYMGQEHKSCVATQIDAIGALSPRIKQYAML